MVGIPAIEIDNIISNASKSDKVLKNELLLLAVWRLVCECLFIITIFLSLDFSAQTHGVSTLHRLFTRFAKIAFRRIVNLAKSAISANSAQVARPAAGAEFTRMIIFPYIS